MNIHEAAEIVNRNNLFGLITITASEQDDEARALIMCTMLSELDTTPISEEWLLRNGWEKVLSHDYPHVREWRRNGFLLWYSDGYRIVKANCKVSTLGELRTLLRLMGGGE